MVEVVRFERKYIDEVVTLENICFHVPWSRRSFEDELENKIAVYFVALKENIVAGYAGMWHVINEGHITNIAVHPKYRRIGIGSSLVHKLINTAIEKEMIGLTLEVNINNYGAQQMYSKYGFKPEGLRKNYYSDTHEDAVIMWKNLL